MSCASAKEEASRPTYKPAWPSGISGKAATMVGRYGPMELRAVCSARLNRARRRSCLTGRGVTSLLLSRLLVCLCPLLLRAASSSEGELAVLESGASLGVFGGWVGKVWYL